MSSPGPQAEPELRQQQTLARQLQESEARLALAVRGGQLGLWDWDLRSGHCIYSERWASMLGYTLDEIEPNASVWEKLLHPDDKARIQPILEANLRGEASSWTWEQRLRHKDGHWVWILGAGAVVERAPDGTPLRAAGTHADISDQKKASAELAEAHRRLALHVSNTPLALVEWDGDYRVTRFTTRAEEMFGWGEAEVLGKRIDEVPWVPEEDWPKLRALMEAMDAGRSTKNVSRNRNRRKDGAEIHCEWHNSSLYDPDGKLVSVLSLVQDVTEAKLADEALRASEERMRNLIRHLPTPTAVMDARGNVVFLNESFTQALGYTQQDVPDFDTWMNKAYPDLEYRTGARTHWNEAIALAEAGTGEIKAIERQVAAKDGSLRKMQVSAVVFDGNMIASLVDLTAHKKAESDLRQTRDYLENLIDHANAPIIVWDPSRKITLFNAAFARMTGYSEAEVMGKDLSLLFPDESRSESLEKIAMTTAGTRWESVEIPIRCKSGEVRIALWNSANVHGADGTPLAATIAQGQDITERKRVEEALRESQRTLLQSQEIAQIGSYVLDLERDHWSSSSELDAIFGIDPDHPRKGSDWVQLVHPEDREAAARALADSIASGSRFDHQYRIVDPRSGETRWVHGLGEFQRGPGGEPVNLIGTIQDITSRKLAEVEREALQGKLALASRLAAMGTLVAGVAHEINNPLAAGLSGESFALEEARVARKRFEGGGPAAADAQRRHLDTIIEALEDASEGSQRVARIVKDLATFATPDPKRTKLSLAAVAADAVRWMPVALSRGADIHVEDEGAPPVLASAGQIEQVVVNLLTNAAKATPPGRRGQVVVRIGPGAPGKARIDVIDQGVGIPPKVRERIFEPFYTTRPVGEGRGAGLGLAICHAIVTEHGGSITVESEVGKGSTFRVELPAAPLEA